MLSPQIVALSEEVQYGMADGLPIVALESTIISHGLPRPENLRVAVEVENAVRSQGAVPATIAVLDGVIRIGLDPQSLAEVANRDDIVKASLRDLPPLVAQGGSGATTVAATSHIAAQAGIRIFATGGLGGVHRQARDTWDESADLNALATTPITVVCSGVKSILDVGATLERLESLNVTIVGYGTDRFPGFYLTDSGHPVNWSMHSPAQIAQTMRMREVLSVTSALVVANPLPESDQLDPDLHHEVLEEGLRLAAARNVSGKDVTPFLLDHFHRATHGASLQVNERIVVRNAVLAAMIAVSDGTPVI